MSNFEFKYGLDEKPPLKDTLLYGLQWFAISLPTIIIIGKVVAGLYFSDPTAQVNYMQKLFFLAAISLLIQLFFGHRLPLIIGPATVLLVGILASQNSSMDSIYSSIMMGGGILALLSITGLFARLEKLFTARVVATILILIALTLTPTIIKLILTVPRPGLEFLHFSFALIFVFAIFLANRLLTGIWKSTLVVWALIAGSLAYLLLVPQHQWLSGFGYSIISNFLTGTKFTFSFDGGVFASFLICFLALSVNDLGSIQSVGKLINPPRMSKRVTAGVALTGLTNMLAGFLNVIGMVNFSLSTGIIAANGVASRFTLVPAGIGLLLISFLPPVVAFIGNIPALIIGVVLLYIMCSQIAAGLIVAFSERIFSFEDGLTLGLPLMLGIIISFLPSEAVNSFPPLLVPILGNGFVVGTLAVLLMEHVVYSKKSR